MKKERLLELKESYEKVKTDNEKIKVKLSYLRLFIFLLLVVFLALFFTKYGYTVILPIITLAAFIYVSIVHRKYFKIVDDTTFKITVLKAYLDRFDDGFKKNADFGLDLKGNSYSEVDLDIYGKSSVFSYISFAKTPYGRKFLSDALKGELISQKDLEQRQEAIAELVDNFEQTLSIESASFHFYGVNDSKKISSLENAFNLISNDVIFDPKRLIISAIFIIALFVSIVLAAIKMVNSYIPLIFLVINFFISKILFANIKPVSDSFNTINNIFYGYNYLLDAVNQANFKSELLLSYQQETKKLSAHAIKYFKLISSLVSARNNVVFAFILNGICLYDGFVILMFKNWQKKYQNGFEMAIKNIGHIEELISLATISLVKEESTRPRISQEFKFEAIKHPLIVEEKCVPNSFIFKGTNIITGSNMSGKTTFMRSIGVNYLLYLSGSDVCAKSFEAPISKLFTSMKVVDDVNNNISTFYGEILRVKDICQYIKTNEPMIVLIDEIFKGTNTKDRITGAYAVAEKLISCSALAIITTHDQELCDIKGVDNYYFLEHYENDKIAFDYTIRKGISNTRNAIYLLKMAGVIED